MRLSGIDKIYYERADIGGELVTIDAKFPSIKNIEIPIAAVEPMFLRTPKGNIVGRLINYRPADNVGDIVSITRHCLYVDEDNYNKVVEAYKRFKQKND